MTIFKIFSFAEMPERKGQAPETDRKSSEFRVFWFRLLTMLDPFFVHVSVRGGLPAHLQFNVTSESMSTVTGFGSTTKIGPTLRKG